MDKKIFSVTMLNRYVKTLIDTDYILSSVLVSGEISNFKEHTSGHAYFTLKDELSSIKCIMFRSNYRLMQYKIKNGDKVIVSGNISVYEKEGQYQLYCTKVQIDGLGSLYIAYEQLKQRLYEKGWFNQELKKPLPVLPSKVGVITSPTGAAVRDIINIAKRRFYNSNILIIPSLVQGNEATDSIINALRTANKLKDIDVLILARGGGSIEDLWCFNDESVAKAIFDSEIPVVSAVGHETDFTIADFVSDLRAPTPSAAAEIVIPEFEKLINNILLMKKSAVKCVDYKISTYRNKIDSIAKSKYFKNPDNLINERLMELDNMVQRIINGQINILKEKKYLFSRYQSKLEVLNPAFVLSRGYSIVLDEKENIIKDANSVNEGDSILVKLSNGELKCEIKQIEGKKLNGK